ncbi:hypothetical protein YPPY01_1375, partial [Yersinia pestis PY-01]
MCWQAATR